MNVYDDLDAGPRGLLDEDHPATPAPAGTPHPDTEPTIDDEEWEVIDAYTRAQMIEDGGLVPVPDDLRANAGFRFPIALTSAAWEDSVAWTDEDNDRKGTIQDQTGRAWDVLTMARHAADRLSPGRDRASFQVLRTPRPGKARRARTTRLVLHCGPGDTPQPVLTVMLEGED